MKTAIAVVMPILFTSGFFGLDNMLVGKRFYNVSLPIDKTIPLRPRWIWMYLLYYPLCFLPLLFPGMLLDDRVFLRTALGFTAQFVVAWFIFYCFPTRIDRPEVHGNSPSVRALRGLYRVDPGLNIFPSLHVANSIYIACLSARFLSVTWTLALFLIACLISASTVLVKQHLFVDVLAGIMLGMAGYYVAC